LQSAVKPATRRELTLARVASGALRTLQVRVETQSDEQSTLLRFLPAAGSLRRLDVRAEHLHARLAAQLPGSRASELLAESGLIVETRAGRRRSASYLLGACSGTVILFRSIGAANLCSRWSGERHLTQADLERPVVFGPSAVLTLVADVIEAAAAGAGPRSLGGGLTVVDRDDSPYPPHRLLFSPTRSRQRVLFRAGEWVGSAGRNNDEDETLEHFLWARIGQAPRPTPSLQGFRSLKITARPIGRVPWPATLIDSLSPLDPPGSRTRRWQCRHSFLEHRGSLSGTDLLQLTGDPSRILERVCAATSSTLIALHDDPIDGESFGLAPFLVTDAALGDLCVPR
jgi:hypothetical protein